MTQLNFPSTDFQSLSNRKLLAVVEQDGLTLASSSHSVAPAASTKHSINTTEASHNTNWATSAVPGDVSNAETTTTTADTTFNCTAPAIDEFPPDGFSRQQRQRGWITLHIVLVCYCFWFLAIICDDYFVPAIENMCASKRLQTN